MTKGINQTLQKKKVQVDNKYMRECLTSFAIKEMQIKTTLNFHFTPVRMAIKQTNPGKENKEPLHTINGVVN
jgi:hypothetical protein